MAQFLQTFSGKLLLEHEKGTIKYSLSSPLKYCNIFKVKLLSAEDW